MVVDLFAKLCNYMQGTILPLYIIERAFSNKVAGLTSTAYMLASLLLRPVTGKMADDRGRYGIAIFGAALYCLATGLYFFTFPVTLLVIMRIIQGGGFSFESTGVYVLATDHIPESRMAEGLGYLGLAQTLATALAPAIAIMLKNTFGYDTTFMVIFSLSALNLIIIPSLRILDRKVPVKKEIRQEERPVITDTQGQKQPFLFRIVDRNALKPSMIMFLIMLANMTMSIFLVPYATLSGIANPGVFFTVQAVMAFIARLTMSRVQKRVGVTAVLSGGILLIFASLTGLVFRLSLPILLVCGVCLGLGIGVVQPQLSAIAVLSAGKENRGKASSTFFMMMDGGSAATGFIFGAVADAAGYPPVYAIAAAVTMCTLFIFLGMRKKGMMV